jgi:hypothetical protein
MAPTRELQRTALETIGKESMQAPWNPGQGSIGIHHKA